MLRTNTHGTKHPQFTIVTITLNAATYLAQTMRSVLTQEGVTLEYLIVDGKSSDATLSIVRQFAAVDSRIRYVSEPDNGISAAMNRGIELATGDIIAFLHADDFYPTSKVLAQVLKYFHDNLQQGWVTGGTTFVDQLNHELRKVPARRFSYQRLLRNNIIMHPATFVRRDAFSSVGSFSTTFSYAMDYDLWIRLSRFQSPLVIGETLACFRVHSGSKSTKNDMETIDEEWQVRKKYVNHPVKKGLHYIYYRLRRGVCWLRDRKVNGDGNGEKLD
ncbi:glycosyltransferase family 2 protein [Geotalea sp. SG265]|uniref:glycosyltransferase family 2 protein n=1 Tax=Geotalea sp. SG265 TaxID=2922867 RepID=UPI001FAF75E6|nr:glycosyltransferase family 2 protein [Geotalea sp. SG265]